MFYSGRLWRIERKNDFSDNQLRPFKVNTDYLMIINNVSICVVIKVLSCGQILWDIWEPIKPFHARDDRFFHPRIRSDLDRFFQTTTNISERLVGARDVQQSLACRVFC